MEMRKAKPIKRRCEMCPAFNRRVTLVSFFQKQILMCELCAKVASVIAQQSDKSDEMKKKLLSGMSSAKFPLRKVTTA